MNFLTKNYLEKFYKSFFFIFICKLCFSTLKVYIYIYLISNLDQSIIFNFIITNYNWKWYNNNIVHILTLNIRKLKAYSVIPRQSKIFSEVFWSGPLRRSRKWSRETKHTDYQHGQKTMQCNGNGWNNERGQQLSQGECLSTCTSKCIVIEETYRQQLNIAFCFREYSLLF